ncbi:hypothetical protein BH11ACT2_BH11ACT2_05370 [soil metagenome]
MSEINPEPEVSAPNVPAGWYIDPSGLPQQRWWDGTRWTHDVTPMKQDLSQLPAPQIGSYSQPQAVPLRREPEPVLALPATPSSATQPFPTRRQLRREFEQAEAARLAAEAAATPHPLAPFAMPSAVPPAESSAELPTAATVEQPIGEHPDAPAASAADAPVEPTPLPVAAVAFAAAIAAPTFAAQDPTPSPIPVPAPVSPVAATVAAPPQESVESSPVPPASWPFAPASVPTSVSVATDPALDPVNSVPYQPFGMIPKTTVGSIAPPDKAATVSVWLIAVMPLIMTAVAVVAVTQLPAYYTRFMQGGLLFIFALVTIALAVRDSRDLRSAGHLTPASPAWVLLTPFAYLVARSIRVHKETGHGTAPLWGWLVIVAAVVAAAALLPDWLEKIVTVTSLF